MITFREIPKFTGSQIRQGLRDLGYVSVSGGKEVINYRQFKEDYGVDKRKLQTLLEKGSNADVGKGDIITRMVEILSFGK